MPPKHEHPHPYPLNPKPLNAQQEKGPHIRASRCALILLELSPVRRTSWSVFLRFWSRNLTAPMLLGALRRDSLTEGSGFWICKRFDQKIRDFDRVRCPKATPESHLREVACHVAGADLRLGSPKGYLPGPKRVLRACFRVLFRVLG